MNKLQQQMNMFDEGGLKDEGGTIDPVSGNDVPIGSSKEEVRDDIPAMLSEGEFVFPADVVRFIGLEKLMMLRQDAKAGLQRMEEMGQMGNSDEATIPDNVPFTIDDLDMEEEREYNEGGVVYANNGQFINRTMPYGITSQPSQMGQQFNIAPQQVDPNQTMQYTNMGGYGPQFVGQQPAQQEVSTFEDLIGKSPGTFDEIIEYTNEAGVIKKVPFKDGKPLYPIEDGFYPVEEKPEELKDPRDVLVKSAKVTEDREGDTTSPQNMRQAEADRMTSYKNTIKAVMEENNIKSVSEAIQFIKDGNHKIKGIPVPGILFKDFQLYDGVVDETGVARPATYGLEQAAETVNEEFKQENVGIKPTVDIESIYDKNFVKEKSEIDKMQDQLQKQLDEEDDKVVAPSQMSQDKEENRRATETARLNAIAEAEKRKQEEKEKQQAKVREAQASKFSSMGQSDRFKTVTDAGGKVRSAESQGGKGVTTNLRSNAKGGLLNKKPKKKKSMKRGGLASKK